MFLIIGYRPSKCDNLCEIIACKYFVSVEFDLSLMLQGQVGANVQKSLNCPTYSLCSFALPLID